MRLVQIAEHYWYEIDGQAALSGVDLMRLPFRRFVLAILSWVNPPGARKEQELEQFNEWLYSPLEGADPDKVSDETVNAEMEAFRAFAKQAGGAG